MRKADAIAYFGTVSAVAEALEVSPSAVSGWDEIIPEGSAYKLEVITKGALKVDPAIYRERPKRGQRLVSAPNP